MSERQRRRRIVEHLRAGRAEDAAQELARSSELYPGDDVLHHVIGIAFASRGTLPAARAELETAATFNPESAAILADLSQVRLAQGEPDKAIESAERSLALDPDLPIARFALGRACFAGECERQARHNPPPEAGQRVSLIDGRTPSYLRAVTEMEAALNAEPPFADAVRFALASAYLWSGHYHAAEGQLRVLLAELPSGPEAERVRGRWLEAKYEIERERYWAIDGAELARIQRSADEPEASAETKLRLAHAYAALGREEALVGALADAHAAGYRPRQALISRSTREERLCEAVSDVHVLLAGGLECIIDEQFRVVPFGHLSAAVFGEARAWRSARLDFASGMQMDALVPSLYRFSLRSPSELVRSGRFTQFSYDPGEVRFAHAVGSRNLMAKEGVIPFAHIETIRFQ